MLLHAVVRNGRLVLDEPTDLPEGEVVTLEPVPFVVEDENEASMSEDERALFRAMIERADADVAAGRYVDAGEWMAARRAARDAR